MLDLRDRRGARRGGHPAGIRSAQLIDNGWGRGDGRRLSVESQGQEIMESFEGRLAVVTGGATGMGRELVIQLAAEGCSVATCDINAECMAETARFAGKDAPAGVRITTHVADVSDEAQMNRFRDQVVTQHGADHVDLLFNNAGIVGGGSFLTSPRAEWDKTFAVCWGGVYNCMRAFADLVVAS